MRAVLIGVIVVHGLIQVARFILAPLGIVWLFSSLLFLATAFFIGAKDDWWWMSGSAAAVISQILVFHAWQSAMYGTVPNLFILAAVGFGFAKWQANRRTRSKQAGLRGFSRVR